MVEGRARLAGKYVSSPVIVCLAVLAILAAWSAVGQQAEATKPKISDQPLTSEQLAVYRAVLTLWHEGNKGAINLATQTAPINPGDDSFGRACLKGLLLEKVTPAEVHRFRGEDVAQLGFAKLRLVDPELQAKDVHENDPDKSISEGGTVDEAVSNGFAHKLFTLGEIQFDPSHMHALVSFSFHCGMLCGNGSTMLMEKKDGEWVSGKQCGGWMS
jgi:hypothetical protein